MISRVQRWIFAPGSAERLAALRIGLFLLLAVRLSRHVYLDLATQPAALFQPISFMRILGAMPSRGVVLAVQSLGVATAVLAAVGLRSRIAMPVAWACGVLLNGMATSIGKVVHNDVMLLLAMVPLLAARASDAWSLDARLRQGSSRVAVRDPAAYGWPVRVAMIVVAGAYFFSGWQKVVNSGPAWVTGGNMRWIMYTSSDAQAHPNGWALAIADRAWLAHLVALFTIVVELGFPAVLWRPRLVWLFLPASVALHVGILLAMRLDYSAQIATSVIVFVDWPGAVRWVRRRRATVMA